MGRGYSSSVLRNSKNDGIYHFKGDLARLKTKKFLGSLPGYAKTMDFSNYAVSSFLPRNEEGLNFSLVLPCKKIKLAKTGETANCHSSGCSGTLHFSPTL